MKILLAFALMLNLNNIYSNENNENIDKLPKPLLDFYSALDDLEGVQARSSGSDSHSIFYESAQGLKEKETDKDLAKIVVIINRAAKGTASDAQRAKVYIDGRLEKTFIVSTGKPSSPSRIGYFRPTNIGHLRLYNEYYSGKYGSRMARAIFYSGGYAIHHTDATNRLGTRASHGCVRFHIDDIDWLNKKIMELGSQNYTLRRWQHEAHKGTSKFNTYYKGLEVPVNMIQRYSGELRLNRWMDSIDTVILVKDETDIAI